MCVCNILDHVVFLLFGQLVTFDSFCDPVDCSPPGSSVHGISQARILEWVAIPFSRGLLDSGMETASAALQAYSLPCEPAGKLSRSLTSPHPTLLLSITLTGSWFRAQAPQSDKAWCDLSQVPQFAHL